MRYVFDTNALILHPHLLDLEGDKIIPLIVLRELDKLKVGTNDTSYWARQAIRKLKQDDSITYDFESDMVSGKSNDDAIIDCARKFRAILISGDYLVQIKAKATDVEVFETDEVSNFYKGYKEIAIKDEDMAELYAHLDNNIYNLIPNQYLIIRNINNNIVDKLRWDGEKLVKLKLPNIKGFKSKHYLQDCAMDLLYNPNITSKILLGTYGSGKTMMSTKISLHQILDKGIFSKLLVVREPVGDGKEIGYLTGDKNSKTADFFKPIEQCLKDSPFQMETLEFNGTIQREIPYFLKGTTFDETVIMVDEAEDMSYQQLKLLGTRAGDKSNVIFAGDYKQSVYDTSVNNGLIQMVNKLKGNPMFGVVDLIEDVRSATSKMFADLD